MAKKTMSTKLTKAEIVFNEDGTISVMEHLKEDTVVHNIEDILRDYEGRNNLNITISTEREL